MTWFSLVCVLATAALVAGEVWDRPRLRVVAKPLASVAFVAHGLVSGVGAWVLAALVLSVVGDVLLLSSEKRYFLGGLAAFLVAHVAYSIAFVVLGVAPLAVLAAAVPFGVFAAGTWRWLSPHVGGMARPVIAYILVITTMVCLAVGVAVVEPRPTRLALLAAAVLFFASDLCVARNRFVAPGPINRAIGLPLYYLAQLVFGSHG
jgi:uncharacterized membrane protein YhhN